MKIFFSIQFISLILSFAAFAQVRNSTLKPDEILTIKTALGIATIIQLPESIQSGIIGDQSAFKVEYMDKAVTIKPLRWGAKTNLYLVTEKRRYNLRLLTQNQETADFIVYVRAPAEPEPVIWQRFEKVVKSKTLSLNLHRIGTTALGFLLLEGQVTSNQEIIIKPDQFWVLQKAESKIINSLFLAQTKVAKNRPIRFGISLARSDFDPKNSITLELRGNSKLAVVIPVEFLWR